MIRLQVVDGTVDGADTGFIYTYREVFNGAPYFETYTDDAVRRDVWEPHLRDGFVVLAYDDRDVVGFGCAVPLEAAPSEVLSYIAVRFDQDALPSGFDLTRCWYMSELGVLESHRGRGLGYRLVQSRLTLAIARGGVSYVMRTAAEGSNSRHLYERIGAELVPGPQDISQTEQVLEHQSQSVERIYLVGQNLSALGSAEAILADRA